MDSQHWLQCDIDEDTEIQEDQKTEVAACLYLVFVTGYQAMR